MTAEPAFEVWDQVSLVYVAHIRSILANELQRQGIADTQSFNVPCYEALTVYPLAVASVEAFLNETFLSTSARSWLQGHPAWSLELEWLGRLEISKKLLLLPLLFLGQTFDIGRCPYQEFEKLRHIRDSLVHFKMKKGIPDAVKDLRQRGKTLPGLVPPAGNYQWPSMLSCTSAALWGYNTACNTVREVVALSCNLPENHPVRFHAERTAERNFYPLTEAEVIKRVSEGIR